MQDDNLQRFHHKIWLPNNINELVVEFFDQLSNVDLTTHAAKELLEDKRGVIPLPSKIELTQAGNLLIEAYVWESKAYLQKAAIRIPSLSTVYDYTYVVAREGFVVSAWANSKTDNHRLLKGFEKFYCPEELRESIRERLEQEDSLYVRKDDL